MAIKTRPSDYEGCHPEIAKLLQQDKDVYCKVSNTGGTGTAKMWVVDYNPKDKYITANGRYTQAEPIDITLQGKPASVNIKYLEDKGFNLSHYGFDEIFVVDENHYATLKQIFAIAGNGVEEIKELPPCFFEEV
jgi:hypothetical protein